MALYTRHQQDDQAELLDHSTMNGSTSGIAPREWDPSFHGSVHTATIAVCIVLVIFVVILGTFGNGLVLLSAVHCRKMRSNFDVLIFNLAGADFIVCLCLSPTFLYLLFTDPPTPRIFCGVFLFSCTACGLLSLLTLVAIAVHRHSRVRKVRGTLTTTKTALILLAIYLASLTSAVGGTLHVTLGWRASNLNCQVVMNSKDIYSNNVVVFFISPVVLISFVTITSSYLLIARAVRLQTFLRTQSLQPILKTSICRPFLSNIDQKISPSDIQNTVRYSHSSTKRQIGAGSLKHCSCCSCVAALDRENKAVSMCFVVILIITLCWMPLVVSHLVELVTGESIIIYQVKLCGIALVFLNSALDPYMYAQNSGRIKQRYGRIFWDMLRCECSGPSKRRIPILSPVLVPQRATRNTLISPDGATLQFLQRKSKKTTMYKQCVKLDNQTEKHDQGKCAHNSTSPIDDKLAVAKGMTALVSSQSQNVRDIRSSRKQQCSQTGVKSLVHKTCCHANSPDDQSLIDS